MDNIWGRFNGSIQGNLWGSEDRVQGNIISQGKWLHIWDEKDKANRIKKTHNTTYFQKRKYVKGFTNYTGTTLSSISGKILERIIGTRMRKKLCSSFEGSQWDIEIEGERSNFHKTTD